MSKIKFIFYLILVFIAYKGFVAFKEFEIGVDNRVAEIEEKADFEKEGEVIGLMMYLGDPPRLTEHLYTENRSKCLEMKQIAQQTSFAYNERNSSEETSFAYYECARVKAVISGKKIVSIIEELEVIE